jgi:H+-transporting ATPase
VIIDAIIGSRKIFQRMKNYAQYSIAMAVRVTFTFGLLTTIYNWYFATILVVIMAILNDGTIMTISKDKVRPSPHPDAWRLKTLFIVSAIYGFYLTISSIILFEIASIPDSVFTRWGALSLDRDTYEGSSRLRGLMYMQVSISGQALIFVTRTRKFSFLDRPSVFLMVAFVVAQIASTLIGVYGFRGYPTFNLQRVTEGANEDSVVWGRYPVFGAGWVYALVAWVWCIIWYIPLDLIKFLVEFVSSRQFTSYFNRTTFNTQLNFGHPYYRTYPTRTRTSLTV